MIARRLATLAVTLLFAGLTACGGGGGDGGNPDDQRGAEPLACAGLLWSTTSPAALENLRIEGLSEALSARVDDAQAELYVEARPAGEPAAGFLPLPVFIDAESAWPSLIVPAPLNVEAPQQARDYDVTLIAGDLACAGPTLTVAGIEAAVGDELDRYLSEVRLLLAQQGAAFGYSTYQSLLDLRQDVLAGGELPPLDMIGTLKAVDALEDFADTAWALPEAERELLQAFMKHVGFIESVAAYRREIEGLGATPLQTALRPARLRAHDPLVPLGTLQLAGGACAALTGDPISISDAFDLDHYMRQQRTAEDAISGDSGAVRQAAMAGAPLLGLVSGGVAAGAGLLLYIEYTIQEFSAGTLPSELTRLGLAVHPSLAIPEDYEVAGRTAYWDNAFVNARSRGFDLTGAALDALSQAVGAGRYFASLGKSGSALGGLATDVGQNAILDEIKNRSGSADCLTVPPQEWRGIDVTAPEWTQSRVFGTAFSLGPRTPTRQDLQLAELGTSELILETVDGTFGGRHAIFNVFITINEQRVRWEPAAFRVEQPGSEHPFTIRVTDTQRPDLAPMLDELPPGVNLISGPTPTGEGTFSVTLGTPTDSRQYPASVRAFREGVLSPQSNRSGTLSLISDRTIELSPATACIGPNASLTLSAELVGFGESDDLRWSVVSGPGTVTPAGDTGTTRTAEVSAIGTEGVIDVLVRATDDSDVRASSRISVGSCDAQLHFWGGLTVAASTGMESSSYDEQVGEMVVPPAKPSSWWRGRTERLASAEQADGELRWRSGEPLRDWSVMASANSEGRLDLFSDGSGTLTYRHEVPLLLSECARNPDPDSDAVSCSSASAGSGGIASHYLDLDAAGNYEIVIEGQCTYEGDAFAGAFVTLNAFRYVGASADPGNVGPPNGPFGNHLDYNGGEFILPQLLTAQDVGNICSADNGRFSYRRVLELDPPVVPGQNDLIYLQFGLSAGAGNNHHRNFDATGALVVDGPGLPPRLGILPDTDPETGSYQGEARIEFTVQVNQR